MKQLKWIVEDTFIFANFLLIAAVGFWARFLPVFVGLISYAVVLYVFAPNPEQASYADGRRGPH